MTIIVTSILFAILLFVVIRVLKADSKNLKDQKKRLEDELIYDPLTGRHLTLEEAENETLVYESEGVRIKSDEEIEANHSEDNKEVEYILRKSITKEFEENEDDRISTLLQSSEVFSDVTTYDLNHLWRIKNSDYIGLAYITSTYNLGRSDQHTFEYQLIGVAQGDSIYDKLESLSAIKLQKIEQTTLFRLTRKANYQDFLKLIDILGVNAR
jgi:hypothetical protein